jgi:hypothetical protein
MHASNPFKSPGTLLLAMLVLSSCAVTTDSTKSSTETFENTTDASSEFTSSTSPRDNEHHPQRARVNEFTTGNFERLRADVAVGNGEHLAALAALLGIAEADRPAFYRFAKARFSAWFSSDRTSAADFLARLRADLARHGELP